MKKPLRRDFPNLIKMIMFKECSKPQNTTKNMKNNKIKNVSNVVYQGKTKCSNAAFYTAKTKC